MCRIVDDVKLFGGKCRKYFLNCPRIEHTSLKRIIILIFSLRLCFLWQMSQKLELKSCLIYYISIIVISSWQEKLWNWNFLRTLDIIHILSTIVSFETSPAEASHPSFCKAAILRRAESWVVSGANRFYCCKHCPQLAPGHWPLLLRHRVADIWASISNRILHFATGCTASGCLMSRVSSPLISNWKLTSHWAFLWEHIPPRP